MSSVYITKIGNVATLHIDTGTYMKDIYTDGIKLFTLPENYRPRSTTNFGTICSYDNMPLSYPLSLRTNGDVFVYSTLYKATKICAFYGIITYIV